MLVKLTPVDGCTSIFFKYIIILNLRKQYLLTYQKSDGVANFITNDVGAYHVAYQLVLALVIDWLRRNALFRLQPIGEMNRGREVDLELIAPTNLNDSRSGKLKYILK